jgi:hypothetical protein
VLTFHDWSLALNTLRHLTNQPSCKVRRRIRTADHSARLKQSAELRCRISHRSLVTDFPISTSLSIGHIRFPAKFPIPRRFTHLPGRCRDGRSESRALFRIRLPWCQGLSRIRDRHAIRRRPLATPDIFPNAGKCPSLGPQASDNDHARQATVTCSRSPSRLRRPTRPLSNLQRRPCLPAQKVSNVVAAGVLRMS